MQPLLPQVTSLGQQLVRTRFDDLFRFHGSLGSNRIVPIRGHVERSRDISNCSLAERRPNANKRFFDCVSLRSTPPRMTKKFHGSLGGGDVVPAQKLCSHWQL